MYTIALHMISLVYILFEYLTTNSIIMPVADYQFEMVLVAIATHIYSIWHLYREKCVSAYDSHPILQMQYLSLCLLISEITMEQFAVLF